MLYVLIGAFLLASSAAEDLSDVMSDEIDVYPYMMQALEELKLRELKKDDSVADNVQHAPDSVCYEELGCFEKNGTFKHLRQLPEPPETVNTHYLLYTRKNPHAAHFMDYKKPETVKSSPINPNGAVLFLTHGFGGRSNLTWLWDLKNALLDRDDVNVIIIDWSLGARAPYYIGAVINSELVGAETSVLFFQIKEFFGIHEKDLHVIGYSLGAQMAGFVGKRMQILRGTKPGRITGLDPANLLFENYGKEIHLYKDDADFVDVLHTNGDRLLYGGVGMDKPIGHADYYPNGGKRQPGCGSTIRGAFIDLFKGEREKMCNHERAVLLFTDSIRSNSSCMYTSYKCNNYTHFEAGKCLSCEGNCGLMGYKAKGEGIYYLKTKATPPYCAGMNKLTVKFAKDIKKSYGALVLTLVGPHGKKENVTLAEKDNKLLPGEERIFVVPITEDFIPLKEVSALYTKYNGWISKGTDTFTLSSINIENTSGASVFKTCSDEIILKSSEYQMLKSC